MEGNSNGAQERWFELGSLAVDLGELPGHPFRQASVAFPLPAGDAGHSLLNLGRVTSREELSKAVGL